MNISSIVRNFFTVAIFASVAAVAWAADDPEQMEQELLAVLQSADSPAADKALTCKRLAVYGSAKSVPALAPLLSDPRLASWARIPLEAIPGEEADQAFRDAAKTLTGRLLIGALNSIGVRRDAAAVDILQGYLTSGDEQVALAAAVALGRIGNESAAKILQGALSEGNNVVRAAAADGGVRCAEQLHTDGDSARAAELYDQVRHADVPKQRVLEATRGAILSRGDAGLPLLVEQLQSPDRRFYEIGLFTAREVTGSEATDVLVSLLLEISPDRKAAILHVLADRGDRQVLPTVMQLASAGQADVRLAAIRALESLGDVSCVQTLLDIAMESDADLSAAAKTTLEKLPDPDVDVDLVNRLSQGESKTIQAVIEAIGKRRIDAFPDLRKAADDPNDAIRHAALLALGETVELENLGFLIDRVVTPREAQDEQVAATALRAAAVRMHQREQAAAKLSDGLTNASTAKKQTLLKILGEMGGPKALQTLGATARSGAPELQDTATRLLGEWMTVDASAELLKLARHPGAYQVRALRGYLRLARQFPMPAEQRVDMCQTAMEVATRDEERKLVLTILERYASLDMLKIAVEATKRSTIKSDAQATCRAIAKKVGSDSAEVKDLLSQAGI